MYVSLKQTQLQKQVAIDTLTEEKDKHIQDLSRKNAEMRQQSDEQSTHIQSLEALTAKMEERIQQVRRENAQLSAEQVPCISGDTGIGDGSGEGELLNYYIVAAAKGAYLFSLGLTLHTTVPYNSLFSSWLCMQSICSTCIALINMCTFYVH